MAAFDLYLFGDSVARGIILDETGRYSPIKESFASLAAARFGATLVNKARFGCTISKGMEILRNFLAARPEARAIVPPEGANPPRAFIEFGGNDCDFRWDEIAANPGDSHFPATALDKFSALYGIMIDTLRAAGMSPVAMTLPPLDAERYFAWFTRKGLDKSAILKWLGDVQQIFRWHESYDKAVRAVATEKSCPIADVRSAFFADGDYRRYICEDGIHPNREGHRLIVSTLASGMA